MNLDSITSAHKETQGKKVFFASDFHLGTDARLTSMDRERQIVRWLSKIQDEVSELYLVGDIFDYWFEYKTVIPRGFSRFLGKLAEMRDQGIPIYFFTGNHDMWMFDYFESEFGIPIYREPQIRDIQGKKLYVAHGDGLGPKDHGYKFIKKVFNNKLCQWTYARLHPNFGLWLMKKFSHTSRDAGGDDAKFYGRENEMLVQYTERKESESHHDYYIFGHRHLPLEVSINNGKSTYFGLGDWTDYQSYGVLEDGIFTLEYFEMPNKTKIVQ